MLAISDVIIVRVGLRLDLTPQVCNALRNSALNHRLTKEFATLL